MKSTPVLDDAREHFEQAFILVRSAANDAEVEIETDIIVGHPAEQIIHRAEQEKVDLICSWTTRDIDISQVDSGLSFREGASVCALSGHGAAVELWLMSEEPWSVKGKGDSMSEIRELNALEILDSRGNRTVQVMATLASGEE